MKSMICLALSAAVSVASAGSLDPPASPISTSPIEARTGIPASGFSLPVVIDEPGSYYLTQNILNVAGTPAIQITASGVMLDLNGFTLAASSSAESPASDGILITGSQATVRNGFVRDWSGSGIRATGNEGTTLENIFALECGGNGLVTGYGGRVVDCRASHCGATGIVVAGDSVVERCQALTCTEGIWGNAFGTTIRDSTANRCAYGIVIQNVGRVEGCETRNSSVAGITAGTECDIRNNSVMLNVLSGIVADANRRIDGNTIDLSGDAIRVGMDCTVTQNHINTCSVAFDVIGGDNIISFNWITNHASPFEVTAPTNFIASFEGYNQSGSTRAFWNLFVPFPARPASPAGAMSKARH